MPDIDIAAADGGSFAAYLATPSSGSGPGVVVIQEIFGVNRVMRDICDGLAAEGYIACSPDLFWRQEPGVQLTDKTEEEWEKAFGYLQGFDFEKGVGDIAATIGHVRGLDGCTGKVGTVGYCMGGSLAYMSACFTDSDASVGYYPDYCPPEAQKTIQDALADNPLFTVHIYPGVDHAFARIGGAHFDRAAADLANGRTAEFFRANLG